MSDMRMDKSLGRVLAVAAASATMLVSSMLWAADKVTVGALGIVADGPYYIALEKGFFADEGLDVTLERFNSAAQGMAPLATNQIQVLGGGSSAALFNAFARDWPVRIVMARTRDMPGFSSDTLIVDKDLEGQVKSMADLKGKTIAVNAPAAVLEYMVAEMLHKAGLTIDDVNIVYMPWPNMGAAFETGAIDAGAVVEPFVVIYGGKKLAFPLYRAADVLTDPPLEVSTILFNKTWSDENPKAATAFTKAYLKGARLYHEAMTGGPARAEVISILTRHTRLDNPAMYDRIQWSYVDPNGEVQRQNLQQQLDWYRARGHVTADVSLDAMIDERFVKEALAELGRVKAD